MLDLWKITSASASEYMKLYMCLQHIKVQCFRRQYTVFSVVFELSRVELYRNDLRENENYLWRVKLNSLS